MSELCLIGTILAASGIRGEVKVRSWSDVPGRFEVLSVVHVGRDESSVREFRVRGAKEGHDIVRLHLEGCDDRNAAEALRGLHLYVRVDAMAAPPEGRYFIHDLIGCEVRDMDGHPRGIVKDVMLLPANDVYVVDARGSEVLLPAVPAIVHSVDTTNKRIVVHALPGLFEDEDED